MPRPRKPRYVLSNPEIPSLKPDAEPGDSTSEPVVLGHDEYEVLRLADYEGLFLDAVGQTIGVSRQTAGRILEKARNKVATALVEGRELRIDPGEAEEVILYICNTCGSEWLTYPDSKPSSHCPSCGGTDIIRSMGVRGGGRGGRRRQNRMTDPSGQPGPGRRGGRGGGKGRGGGGGRKGRNF